MSGRLLHAAGMAAATFLSGLAVYKGFSELSWDAVYQPLVQSLLMGLATLGIGPAAAWATKPRGNGTPDGGLGGGVKLGLLLLVVLVASAGCATLGLQSDTIALPRDATLIAYGQAKATFLFADYMMTSGCAAGRLDPVLCKAGADLRGEAKTLDALLTAALVDKRGTLTPQDLQRFIALGGQLAALAGYPTMAGVLAAPKP